jgi:hypothetical protein
LAADAPFLTEGNLTKHRGDVNLLAESLHAVDGIGFARGGSGVTSRLLPMTAVANDGGFHDPALPYVVAGAVADSGCAMTSEGECGNVAPKHDLSRFLLQSAG